jgi:hypothetical protein
MDNTEKLLRALIDALGFDVEEVDVQDADSFLEFSRMCEEMGGNMVAKPDQFYTTEYKLISRANND